jgi:hypothetical protein
MLTRAASEAICEWKYNPDVVNAPQNDSGHKQRRHAIYASETSGLLLIAFLVLIVTIIRYWHAIHWSMR